MSSYLMARSVAVCGKVGPSESTLLMLNLVSGGHWPIAVMLFCSVTQGMLHAA